MLVIKIIKVYMYKLNQLKMSLLKSKYKKLLVGVLTIVALVSCSDPWDDRQQIDDANLKVTLDVAITNTAGTSEFTKLLVQTGYDTILAASKTYTVFVPTNEAIAQVDSAILGNPEALKEFVGNHIALTAFSSVRGTEETQIKMFSAKYLIFKGAALIDDATIIDADHYAANGVFHVINKALTPKMNIWQYINSKAGSSAMSDYLLSLNEFSIYASDVTSKETAAAFPGIYSDSLSNSYLKNVYNLNNEKNSYTFFLMEDDGYNAEVDKMKPYLIKKTNDPTIDSTAIYSKYFTLRDMAYGKKYEIDNLPASLTSRFGVEVPIDKTQIVGQIRLSNGIVYIMKKVDVPLAKRLLTKKIEGENNSGYWGSRNKIFYRDKVDPFGVFYNDIMVQDPGKAEFTLMYKDKDFFSTKYKVYWRAINDRQSNVFQQRLRIGGKWAVVNTVTTQIGVLYDVPLTNVELNNYTEVYLGEFTLTEAIDIDLISLVAANNTVNGNNSLTLDYLKFVPEIK